MYAGGGAGGPAPVLGSHMARESGGERARGREREREHDQRTTPSILQQMVQSPPVHVSLPNQTLHHMSHSWEGAGMAGGGAERLYQPANFQRLTQLPPAHPQQLQSAAAATRGIVQPAPVQAQIQQLPQNVPTHAIMHGRQRVDGALGGLGYEGGYEGGPHNQQSNVELRGLRAQLGRRMAGAEAEEMVNATTADLTTQSPEEQVVELVRALLLHMRISEGKEWVDITNMPKAAHMMQRKRPVVGVSLRWGSRDVGPEEVCMPVCTCVSKCIDSHSRSCA
mgnify:CR=1 FL=1